MEGIVCEVFSSSWDHQIQPTEAEKDDVVPLLFGVFFAMTVHFLDSILIVSLQFKSVFIQLFTVFLLNLPINKDSFTFVF